NKTNETRSFRCEMIRAACSLAHQPRPSALFRDFLSCGLQCFSAQFHLFNCSCQCRELCVDKYKLSRRRNPFEDFPESDPVIRRSAKKSQKRFGIKLKRLSFCVCHEFLLIAFGIQSMESRTR